MHSSEYDDLLASLQKIVRQAYDLGRQEALKQVVEVLKSDPVPPKPLALPAPDPKRDPEPAHAAEAPVPMQGSVRMPGDAPASGPAASSTQAPTTQTHGVPDRAPVSNSAPAEPVKEPLSVGVLGTPAKTADAPARTEEKPSTPWWAR